MSAELRVENPVNLEGTRVPMGKRSFLKVLAACAIMATTSGCGKCWFSDRKSGTLTETRDDYTAQFFKNHPDGEAIQAAAHEYDQLAEAVEIDKNPPLSELKSKLEQLAIPLFAQEAYFHTDPNTVEFMRANDYYEKDEDTGTQRLKKTENIFPHAPSHRSPHEDFNQTEVDTLSYMHAHGYDKCDARGMFFTDSFNRRDDINVKISPLVTASDMKGMVEVPVDCDLVDLFPGALSYDDKFKFCIEFDRPNRKLNFTTLEASESYQALFFNLDNGVTAKTIYSHVFDNLRAPAAGMPDALLAEYLRDLPPIGTSSSGRASGPDSVASLTLRLAYCLNSRLPQPAYTATRDRIARYMELEDPRLQEAFGYIYALEEIDSDQKIQVDFAYPEIHRLVKEMVSPDSFYFFFGYEDGKYFFLANPSLFGFMKERPVDLSDILKTRGYFFDEGHEDNLAEIYALMKNIEGAKEKYQYDKLNAIKDRITRRVSRIGDSPKSNVALGQLYMSLGQHHQAKHAYRQALEVDPNFIIYCDGMEELEWDESELRNLGLLNDSDPENPAQNCVRFRATRANFYNRKGDLISATNELVQLCLLDPYNENNWGTLKNFAMRISPKTGEKLADYVKENLGFTI